MTGYLGGRGRLRSDLSVRRSAGMRRYPRVTASTRGCPPNRARNGHVTFRSVDSCTGVWSRSKQSATSGSSMRVVHASPEHHKVVHPRGSQLMTARRPSPLVAAAEAHLGEAGSIG